MSEIDLHIRCKCGAAVIGCFPRNRLRNALRMFRVAHSAACQNQAKRGKR